MSVATKAVLLVDDTQTTRASMARFLEKELQWWVCAAGTKAEALEQLASGAIVPDLVLLDQVLGDDPNGGTHAIPEIVQASPRSFVVVYTADPNIDEVALWCALAAGAHRYIRKGSPTELLADLQEFVNEVEELAEVTKLVREVTETRGAMVSTLLGLGVQVSVLDRYHRVWFSNRPESARPALPVRGGPCWSYFHGTPPEWGPCTACTLRYVVKSGSPRSQVVLTRTPGGRLEWARVESLPILSERSKLKRVIAVREAYMPLPLSTVELNQDARLQAIADCLLTEGYGRARIYTVEGAQITGVACASHFSPAEHEAYRQRVLSFHVVTRANRYAACAIEQHDGTLWRAWASDLGGPDTDVVMQLDLEPPWADVPVWDGPDLVGWLAIDLKGAPRRSLEDSDLTTLRRYRDEIASVLGQDPAHAARRTVFRPLITETRFKLAGARDAQQALEFIVQAVRDIIHPVSACRDVRVRVRRAGQLDVLARLELLADDLPVRETDPRSFAAFVATVQSPLYIDDCAEYARRAVDNPAYRPGLREQRSGSLAILPLKVENVCFGTLSVECKDPVHWQDAGPTPYLVELAGLAALAVRDICVQQQLAEGKQAVERELEQAFGAIHGIKGPATAARNALDVLLCQELPPQARRAAELVEAGVGRIERLAERLVRMTRPRGKSVILERWTVRELAAECCRAAGAAQPSLDVRAPRDTPDVTVRCVAAELWAIFEELATNSSRAGATEVVVSCRLRDDHLVIEFDDNGRGFDADKAEQIFERWYSEFGGGNGLGLPWVRSILAELGGAVCAQCLCTGARIEMSIPCAKAEDNAT